MDFEGSQGADTGKYTMFSCSYSVVELQNECVNGYNWIMDDSGMSKRAERDDVFCRNIIFVSTVRDFYVCEFAHWDCHMCVWTYRLRCLRVYIWRLPCLWVNTPCESSHKDCHLNCQSLHLHGSMALMYLGSPSRVIATQHVYSVCLAAVFTLWWMISGYFPIWYIAFMSVDLAQ